MHAVLPGPVSDIFQCIPINFKTCSSLQWLRTAEEDDPEAEASPAEIAEDQQKVSRAPVPAKELQMSFKPDVMFLLSGTCQVQHWRGVRREKELATASIPFNCRC